VPPADETPGYAAEALPPNTTPITNIAGMNAAGYAPTVRSTFFDVSPDGRRVEIAWLHNKPKADGSFDTSGEPVTYATVGDPAVPSSFKAPQAIGRRMFDVVAGYESRKVYNLAHNAPFVVGDRKGGFIGLTVPMNANGYAEGMPATNFGYGLSTLATGATTWSAQGKAFLTRQSDGSSLSEMSGNMDPAGNAHVFGQGHLGLFQSGFGYQRLKAGAGTWDSKPLGSAYRTSSVNFFCEGGGYAAQVKNKQGFYDLHAAFAWNKAGITPLYGLSYVVSHDGGTTWQTAAGQALTLPVKATDTHAAVFAANLNASTGTGAVPGHSVINVGAADDGTPLIIRPNFTDSTRQAVQHHLYAYSGGRWVDVPVGPALYWNAAGNGVAYNGVTGKVNVVLLDPGSYAKPARILLESIALADLKAGKSTWKEEVICSVTQSHYASSLKVREVKNTKFVCLFDGEYHNPGTVQPVLVESPMR
jgi:hypothetical protein